MTIIVITFLIILYFIAQVYAPAVIKPAAATMPIPKTKQNFSQANYGPKPISKKWPANHLASLYSAAKSGPVISKDLSEIAKKFYEKHASLLTPGVSKSDYKIQKLLSTGEDGSVYIVLRKNDHAKFALKEMELTPKTNLNELAEQIDIQAQATKDNRTHINNVFAVFLDKNKICMVLKLMKGKVDYNITKLTEKEFCGMAKGMMEDLVYLEEKGISHRDLDMCNLLVNEKDEIVKCTIKVDVWAIGIFLRDMKRRITDASDALWLMLSPDAVFNVNPALRPSFSDMLSSPLFKQC